jgi:hypothetical protein
MSKYAFVFSDDEEEDDYNDDDYQPVKKSTIKQQTKKNVKSSKAIPKKAVKPKNNITKTKKKILSKIVESESSIYGKEEEEEDLAYWKTLDNEKSNLIDTQKAAIEKLMEENIALQKRLIQGVNNIQQQQENDGVMTPEVISECEEEEKPVQSNEEEREEKKIVNNIVVVENRYDWLGVITDDTRCRELYHISSFQLMELDKFISPHFASTENPIHKSLVYSKQLLMLLDYILNGTPIDEIANRAQLPSNFVSTLLHLFISHAAATLQKETILILNQNLTEVNFNGRYYFLIDPKNGKIVKHKFFASLVKFRIKWPYKNINISPGHYKFSSELLCRMTDLFRIMSNYDSLTTNRNIMPLIYAIWNRLGYM